MVTRYDGAGINDPQRFGDLFAAWSVSSTNSGVVAPEDSTSGCLFACGSWTMKNGLWTAARVLPAERVRDEARRYMCEGKFGAAKLFVPKLIEGSNAVSLLFTDQLSIGSYLWTRNVVDIPQEIMNLIMAGIR